MADTNPTLTAPLRIMRDNLLEKRLELYRQAEEVETQIEAVDKVISMYDSSHVPMDVRSDHKPIPMVEVHRPLQLASPEGAPKALSGKAKAQPAKAKPLPANAKAQPEAKAAPARKSQSADAKHKINTYFAKFNRNDAILKFLQKTTRPVKSSEVAEAVREMHPIQLTTSELKTIFLSRISASMYFMKDRGITVRNETGESGKKKDVYWTLSDSHRKPVKKKPENKKAAEAQQSEQV